MKSIITPAILLMLTMGSNAYSIGNSRQPNALCWTGSAVAKAACRAENHRKAVEEFKTEILEKYEVVTDKISASVDRLIDGRDEKGSDDMVLATDIDIELARELLERGLSPENARDVIRSRHKVFKIEADPIVHSRELALQEITVKSAMQLEAYLNNANKYGWIEKSEAAYGEFVAFSKANEGAMPAKLTDNLHSSAYVYVMRHRNRMSMVLRKNYFMLDVMERENSVRIVRQDRRGNEILSGIDIDDGKIKSVKINPYDATGQSYLRDLKVSLAASLVSLDMYEFIVGRFLDNDALRDKIFSDIQPRYQQSKQAIKSDWDRYEHYLNSKKTRYAINLFLEEQEMMAGVDLDYLSKDAQKYDAFLNKTIKESFMFQFLTGAKSAVNGKTDFQPVTWTKKTREAFVNARNASTYSLSKLFGNGIGDSFIKRYGKMHSLGHSEDATKKEKLEVLKRRMKPLDILVEKTPFRVTDRFIPGHWGHVAIWVGTEAELKEIGAWETLNNLYAKAKDWYGYTGPSFQQLVRDGHHIIEALRPGVQLNSLEHFLDIDDMAVLRPKFCKDGQESKADQCIDKSKSKEYMYNAFKQIGKAYDFNFDTNTVDLIVCSEIAFSVFTDIEWETDASPIGGQSISPDQVAYKADSMDNYFQPEIIFYNGKEVNGSKQKLQNVFNLMVATDYDKVEAETGICQDYDKCYIEEDMFKSNKKFLDWKDDNGI
jgi:hypothetical protein